MNEPNLNRFDSDAANWDTVSQRVELARAVGEAILLQVGPSQEMDVLDYGCGTGLLGLFLLPHVRSVTGADSSSGMLKVLEEKIQAGGLRHMRTERLDLQQDPPPSSHYHLIVANMVMHHVEQTTALLKSFYQMLPPGGVLALSDLDTEPGIFHGPDTSGGVFHHGFDRHEFKGHLRRIGFEDVKDITAHVIQKPIASGEIHEFPVFLITGKKV